jgi:type II secretory pathway component HofQ
MNTHANPLLRCALAGALLALATVATAATGTPATSTTPAGATTTINFDDIPVRSALQLIAEQAGFNLVVTDSVKGNITLHLRDVTWEQALAVVLRLKGLGMRVDATGSVTVTGK